MEGVGKTCVANLMSELSGFKVTSFLTPIADFAREHMKWDGKMDCYGRRVLDSVCRSGRRIDKNFWLNLAMHKVDPECVKVVFDDLFFENEENLIKSLGGKVVLVSRPGVANASECLKPDFTIVNDGTINDLRVKVSGLISAIL